MDASFQPTLARRPGCTALEQQSNFDPYDVSVQPMFHVEFRQPFCFGHHVDTVQLGGVGRHWANADGAPLETAKQRPAAAVVIDLLVEEDVGTRPRGATEERQVLCHGEIEMELVTALVMGLVVFRIEVEAGEAAQLQADLAAQITGGDTGLEGPIVLPEVGELPEIEVSGWRIDAEGESVLEVAALPADQQGQQRDVSQAIGGFPLAERAN